MKTFGWFTELYDQVKDKFEFKLRSLELEITESLLAVMKNRNMSRADLAGRLGTSKAAVSKLLNDGSNITLKRLLKISEALDCHLKVEIVPDEEAAIVYELTIPVLFRYGQASSLSEYWIGSMDTGGKINAQADHYESSTTEGRDNASAA